MGLLSLLIGFICEFTFMKPEWVEKFYSLNVDGKIIVAVIISAIYWFIIWGAPTYILQKYFSKNNT